MLSTTILFFDNVIIEGTCTSEGADCKADIAELMHSKKSADTTICISRDKEIRCSLRNNFTYEFESGDVVCIDETDPQHIKFCDKAYDTSVLSVVNYEATQIIGQRAPYPVAIAGNIPVKVICDTPIQIGDLLVTSNIEGYAQSFKAWQPTATLDDMKKVWEHTGSPFAKALEPCNSGTAVIRAWLI